MDQRKRRLALLMLGYMVRMIGVVALMILAFYSLSWIVDMITPLGLMLVVAAALVITIAYFKADDELTALEREERRVMDRMRMDD